MDAEHSASHIHNYMVRSYTNAHDTQFQPQGQGALLAKSIIRLGLDKAGARIVFKTLCAISFEDPSVAAEAFQLPFDESGGRQADTLRKRSPRMMIRTHASSAESKTPE